MTASSLHFFQVFKTPNLNHFRHTLNCRYTFCTDLFTKAILNHGILPAFLSLVSSENIAAYNRDSLFFNNENGMMYQ